MMVRKRGKRSQIAIFVIIALILVVTISLIFFLFQRPTLAISPVEDPKGFVESCSQDAAIEAINTIIPRGGYLAPTNTLRFNNIDVAYLCYTEEDEALCTNQEPLLIERMEEEIFADISPKIEDCFQSLEQSLRKFNYEAGPTELEVKILPRQVLIDIRKEISFVKQEQPQRFETFDATISSPLFDFALITNEVINEEVDCECGEEACDANFIELSRAHRDFETKRAVFTGRGEEIYTIKDIKSDKEFVFAIRNCVRVL